MKVEINKNLSSNGGYSDFMLPSSDGHNLYGFYPASPNYLKSSKERSNDINYNAEHIKSKAKKSGADLVGICKINYQWLRKNSSIENQTVDFSRVIVIGIAMNTKAFRKSPSPEILAETRNGYWRMEHVACELGRYIATLGYNAFSSGNGEALSVAQAIDAGLGQLGRNGLLITEEFGSCLRICKIFTDMPLKADEKTQPILAEMCRDCDICVKACPAGAIESGSSPSKKVWIVNSNRCGLCWKELKKECSACISACPATWEKRVI